MRAMTYNLNGVLPTLRMMLDPTYYIRKAKREDIRQTDELLSHIRSFAPGSQWRNLERMILSEGAELQKGLRVWYVPVDERVKEYLTTMLTVAEKDVCVRDIHNHETIYGAKFQTTFVAQGEIVLYVHDGKDDHLPIATTYSAGETFIIRPDVYHTTRITKGTLLLTNFTPAI